MAKQAEAASKKAQLAKAAFKQARQAFKQAKKAAKQARKKAKAATKAWKTLAAPTDKVPKKAQTAAGKVVRAKSTVSPTKYPVGHRCHS